MRNGKIARNKFVYMKLKKGTKAENGTKMRRYTQ